VNVRGEHNRIPGARGWQAIAALVLTTVALAAAVMLRSPLPGEIAIMREVQSWPVATIARLGILAGESWVDALVAAIAAAALFAIWRRPGLAAFVVTCALFRMISTPLKLLVGRARPDATQVRVTEIQDTYAFPSGHTLGATLCWGALAVVVWLALRGRVRYPVALVLIAVPLATALGRMYVGAHWPTDVVAGWLIGSIPLVAMAASARTPSGQSGPLDRMGPKSDGSHKRGWHF